MNIANFITTLANLSLVPHCATTSEFFESIDWDCLENAEFYEKILRKNFGLALVIRDGDFLRLVYYYVSNDGIVCDYRFCPYMKNLKRTSNIS